MLRYIFSVEGIILIILLCIAIYYYYQTDYKSGRSYEFMPNVPKLKNKGLSKGQHKGEEQCRKIFEEIFARPFKSCRPDFLKNPATGRNLELDGFCPSIKTRIGTGLAFERDGEQHSMYVKKFHNLPSEFIYQVKKDSWKDAVCKQRGIMLIRIPYYVTGDNMENYIRSRLREEKVLPPALGTMAGMVQSVSIKSKK